MALFKPAERSLARAISRLVYTNPFLPERVDCERDALGDDFNESAAIWFPEDADLLPPEEHSDRPNVALLRERSAALAEATRTRLLQSPSAASTADLDLYADVAAYALYARYESDLWDAALDESPRPRKMGCYASFSRDFDHLLRLDGCTPLGPPSPDHAFALFFQIRRAFHYIFRSLLGSSLVIAKLRAETWHSVFTHDLRRYSQGLYLRMHDIPTLITGPSGTGKDLVARAIGYSRFIPFDARRGAFAESFIRQYQPLNLSALAPALIESELFGHRRGAFTGAVENRIGFLESCGPEGTVFLDEVGELPPELQVKLLRVLQSRQFQRIGETTTRMFLGKIVAATNRDLGEELRAGRLRDDLYYRLCADRIETPSLRARLRADAEELPRLVRLLSKRIAGAEYGPVLSGEVVRWVERHLSPDYSWPGNVRELEQCVRNVMVRGSYEPAGAGSPRANGLDRALLACGLSAEALVEQYCRVVYAETGSYVETGRRLGLDRRTVKARVESRWEPRD